MPPLPLFNFYQFAEDSDPTEKPQAIPKRSERYSPLALSRFSSVWIDEKDLPELEKFAQSLLTASSAHSGSAIPVNSRMQALRDSAILVMNEIMEAPSPETIQKGTKIVGSFVYLLMKDPKAYLFLSKLSSHDHYTLQHSVGAAVNSIILARKLGIHEESELIEVGMSGLLHDIGKIKVNQAIINKPGPLDATEWQEMQQHSQIGYEIIKDQRGLTDRTKRAILEHHEDKNGTGYPLAMRFSEVDLFSKIVCICDIFNALTTDRSYSKALSPLHAFQLMREKMKHKIDDELFKQLVLVYGEKL